MKRIAFILIACVLALAPVSALAHAHMDQSKPASGSTVAASPNEVSVSFTEAVEPKFSSIVVQDAKGVAVQVGKAEGGAGNTAELKVKLKPSLPPGVYTVIWKILSVDTHRTEGSFRFTVKP